jgi:DNA polymerase elongation subunit (family B)
MFEKLVYLNLQETSYHSMEKNRILSLGAFVTYESKRREVHSWNARGLAEENQLLVDFGEFLETLNESTTLFITYDGKEYDFRILLSRALIHEVDLSRLFTYQHLDIFSFLKSHALFGSNNIFDIALFLNCESVADEKTRQELKGISAPALAASQGIEAVEKYNLTVLTILTELFTKTKAYLFPEYKWSIFQKKPLSEDTIFG